MKIRNIVFSGFMASILMAGGAYATDDAGSLTTKTYVDTAYNTNATAIANHAGDTVKHITAAERTAWTGKQDALDDDQMAAVDSGITAEKVEAYDGYANTIEGKANKATTLAGYGITDAMTAEDITAAISVAQSTATYNDTDVKARLNAIEGYDDAYKSGITAALVEKITTNETNITNLGTSKQDKITTTNKLPAASVSGLATVATSGAYSDLSGKPTNVSTFTNDAGYIDKDVADLTNYTTSTLLNASLNGKQDTISDLEDIRSGAAAGASAIQSADLNTALADYTTTADLLPVATTACETDYCYINGDGEAVPFATIDVFNAGTLDTPSI